MPRSSSLVIHRSQRTPLQGPDRLPLAVAAPIVLALALLCWVAVWQMARLVL